MIFREHSEGRRSAQDKWTRSVRVIVSKREGEEENHPDRKRKWRSARYAPIVLGAWRLEGQTDEFLAQVLTHLWPTGQQLQTVGLE